MDNVMTTSPASNDAHIRLSFDENQLRRDDDLLSYGMRPF